MRLIALMPVRNEAWMLGYSLRMALRWCDEVVVLDHASTDDSRRIAMVVREETGNLVHLLFDTRGEWPEMEHRQRMLKAARGLGATHIAMVDADEVLTANLVGSIRGKIEASDGHCVGVPGYNLRGGLDRYHVNGVWGHRRFSLAFRDNPALGWSGDTFHSREPRPQLPTICPCSQGDGGVLHLWGASERRLRAKHALYKLVERIRWPGKPVAEIDRMYSLAIHGDATNDAYGTPKTWGYSPVPPEWWDAELRHYIDVDAVPWQEAECRKLLEQHGTDKFIGLDLFGVI